MPTTAADGPIRLRRRLLALLLLALAACGDRAPSEVEIGKALGNALSEDGRNPLWEMQSFAMHGSRFDPASQRMVASVDYTIRLKVSRPELAALLDQSVHSAAPDAAAIDRIETALAFLDVALGKDWAKGATYGCRAARLELVRSRDGWVLPGDSRLALCPPG
jgi:hypothetical protein